MPNSAMKFRAWLNPKYIHYSGLDAFERIGARHDPKQAATASMRTRLKGGTNAGKTRHDDQADYAREHYASRGAYEDPKDHQFRDSAVLQADQPDFVTFFPKKSKTQLAAADARRFSATRSRDSKRRSASRGDRRRSKQLDGSDRPPSARSDAEGRRAARLVNAPRTPRGGDGGRSPRGPAKFGGPVSPSSSRLSSRGSRRDGPRALPPPMSAGIRARTAKYGKGIDFRDPKALFHLVQKERRSAVAARQQKMIKGFTRRFLGDSSDDARAAGTAPPPNPSVSDVAGMAQSYMAVSPVTAPGTLNGGGSIGMHGTVDHFPMGPPDSPPGYGPPGTGVGGGGSGFLPPASPGYGAGAAGAGGGGGMYGRGGAGLTTAVTMPAIPTAEDMRVMTAFTGSLAGTLRFGESTLERVDVPKAPPKRLMGSRGGLAAVSKTSMFAPSEESWHGFATHKMECVPDIARYGKIKVGITYCFPVSVRNLGLTPKRFRVANTTVRDDSVPALLHCRYPAIRLAPGVSEIIEIFAMSEEPGRLWGDIEIVSEHDSFTLPVTAHVLSEPAFEAEREATTGGRLAKPEFDHDANPFMYEHELVALNNVIPKGGTNAKVQVVVEPSAVKEAQKELEAEGDEELHHAALKVQKSFRGHLGRKKATREKRKTSGKKAAAAQK